MSKTGSFTFSLMLTLMLALSLSACEPVKTPERVENRPGVAAAALPETTEMVIPQLEVINFTPTPMPVAKPTQSNQDQNGVILLAMKSGGFSQLFMYHPVNTPLTQITTGEWNNDEPAISPDGTKIAYCADEAGRWDIYILDLVNGNKTRLTETASYACSPTWSPDGRWLAHEEILDGKLNLVIRSIVDPSTAPVRLTNNGANNFDPAWSPRGREIAFVSDRNGRLELWLANLDNPEKRFIPIARSDHADYTSPAWSIDGSSLAWRKSNEFEEVESLNRIEMSSRPVTLGSGYVPVWMDNPAGILAQVRTANSNDLVAYSPDPSQLLLPPIHLQAEVTSLEWVPGAMAGPLSTFANGRSEFETRPLWQLEISTQDTSSGRYDMVYIEGLTAPEPYLADTVNESFNRMRTALQAELGWDFLKTLENATVSIPANAATGLDENWAYTGRAIAVNMDPLDSGWMMVNREDILGRTYWRLWLKCREQDGSCGVPIQDPIWDFGARLTGDAEAYENGGKNSVLPQEYWVDFTSFAQAYNWERQPAGSNWRGYFPETRINLFVLDGGLSWFEAMRERFSIETINEYWPNP